MRAIKSGDGSELGAKHCFEAPELSPQPVQENEMFEFDDALRSRRIVTLFFALVAGISAVSTALVPAILRI